MLAWKYILEESEGIQLKIERTKRKEKREEEKKKYEALYYEDDISCNEERYTSNQLENVIQKIMNTTERRNLRYQRKSRKGKQSEVNKEGENAEKRKEKQKLKGDVDFEVF